MGIIKESFNVKNQIHKYNYENIFIFRIGDIYKIFLAIISADTVLVTKIFLLCISVGLQIFLCVLLCCFS